MNKTQEELEKGIGTKEAETLEPTKVKIENIEIEEVGEKKNKKAVFEVKHPDREETIKISKIKYERNKRLRIVGSWYSLDEDELIQKGSALAVLMNKLKAKTLKDMIGREPETDVDDDGYLCIKAY